MNSLGRNPLAATWRFLVVMIVLSIGGTKAQGQGWPALRGFEFERRVALDSAVVVGAVGAVIPLSDRMLVIDHIGQAIHLFDSTSGDHIRTLDVATCRPGSTMMPLDARAGGSFLLISLAGLPMMRFSFQGDCLGPLNPDLLPVAKWDVDDHDRYLSLSETKEVVEVHDPKGVSVMSIRARHSPMPNLERRWLGGGLRWTPKAVYVVGVVPDSMAVVNTLTGSVKTVSLMHLGLRIPSDRDLPARAGASLATEFQGIARSSTLVNELYSLTQQRLLLYYNEPSGRGFKILDLDGIEIDSDSRFPPLVFAGSGRAYFAFQPMEAEDGELKNPEILVYKYVGR